MKLKVKELDISSGGALLVVLNSLDAAKMDLHSLDRVKLFKHERMETATVHIAENNHVVQEGYVGIYHEMEKALGLKNEDIVKLTLARKPLSLEYIRKKLDGQTLNKREIDQIVWDITHNKLSDIELTYFVAACYTNALSMEETVLLTKAIASHGTILNFGKGPILDKHCIGGIPGNRTTMILVPLMAAAGYTIPKTSSRSITSPAGTADTMEALACVSFSIDDMKRILKETKGCIVWGGALNLAPADDKIIHVEKPLEIDAESQLLASIMAKKYSVSSTHILIDVPVGNDAKVKNKHEAEQLKKHFEQIGKKLGKKIRVILTDGSQPIGNGIGPALEARDVLWVLKRDAKRPLDLERKCTMMAAEMLAMVGVKNGKQKAIELLESGAAYKKMQDIIKAQLGKELAPEELRLGSYTFEMQAQKAGKITDIDNIIISKLARIAGAPSNKGAGLFLHKHIGDKVKRGDALFTIYSESREKLHYATDVAHEQASFVIR
jgi:AMP phosphorylase